MVLLLKYSTKNRGKDFGNIFTKHYREYVYEPLPFWTRRYIFRGFDAAENMLTEASEQTLWRTFELMKAIEEAKNTLDESRLCHLIETYRLTWEQCPTLLLKKRTVLMSLLKYMPIEALVRKLGLMTSHQVFDGPNGEGTLVSHKATFVFTR